ncbi:MAG: alanine dehydrogenase [Planctomycetota bacterium]|jgi:alanine dehydrogenase
MIIAVPREIKEQENRVAVVPAGIEQLCQNGHDVLVEKNAGIGSGIRNEDFKKAGARIIEGHKEIFKHADMVIKVKEPLPSEYELLKKGQIIFTYFHFAASATLTRAMLERKVIAIAYETIETEDGRLPLLEPMSEVAGRMAVQEGAKYLEEPFGGKGVLLSGVPGVAPAKVLIIGGGIVGTNSAMMAAGLKADVTIMDIDLARLRYLDQIMPANVKTAMSSRHNISKMLRDVDLVIGAVLIPGAKAPKLITREMLSLMTPGSVIVDVAVDQGGCVETCRPTTHSDPVFVVDGIIHYCVANMPGAVPKTSTFALTNATLPYAIEIANKGYEKAAEENRAIAAGVSMIKGKITCKNVAQALST